MEQELKIAEEARISAEQDAAAQRYAVNVLQVSQSTSSVHPSEIIFSLLKSLTPSGPKYLTLRTRFSQTYKFQQSILY